MPRTVNLATVVLAGLCAATTLTGCEKAHGADPPSTRGGDEAGPPQAEATPTEKAFVSGGTIEMQLDGGNYEVRAGADSGIRVTLSGNTGQAKAVVDTTGTRADIKVTDTPHSNFKGTIEVPATSDLRIRLSGGNLTVGAIKGNKDVESQAGNTEIAVGNPDDYGNVDVSVTVGNIESDSFGGSKSGLMPSLKWTGPGKYAIHAHSGAGNLTLRK